MNTVRGVLLKILETLQKSEALSGINFVQAYPKGFKQSPLTDCVVTVGLGGVEMEPGAFSGYFGEDSETGREIFAQRSDLQIKLEIYIPQLGEGMDCADCFTSITECLLAGELGGALLKIESGSVEWDRQAAAYLLPVTMKMKAILGSESIQNETGFDEIIVKGVM